jgi:hypothetical protein
MFVWKLNGIAPIFVIPCFCFYLFLVSINIILLYIMENHCVIINCEILLLILVYNKGFILFVA